jgi:heme/copper-type cytochrome/quinol oxidase subunit 1
LALLGTLATVLASLPYYIAGFAKQPGNVTQFDYDGPQNLWNVLAGVGHALVVLTVLAFVGLAIKSFRSGALAGDDPWDGQTLEWATTSPAPINNFAQVHAISSAEPLLDLKPSRDGSGGTA